MTSLVCHMTCFMVTPRPQCNPSDDFPNRILVKGNNGLLCSKNLDTNYISRFPDSVRGCLGYGSIDRVFRDCPQRENSDIKQKFFKNLWAHVPSTRKTVSFTNPTTTPTSNIDVSPTQTHPPSQSSIKKPRFYAIFVCMNNLTSPFQKPMPIQINNSLPSIYPHLGLNEDEENKTIAFLSLTSTCLLLLLPISLPPLSRVCISIYILLIY